MIESIVIPAAGAIITGILAGALAAAVGWPGWPVGLGAALVAWLLRPGGFQTMPGIELPAAPKEQTVRVNILSLDGRQGDYLSLGITPDQLQALAEGLSGGRALACREWTGRGAAFSQSEFARLRSKLIAGGLARWVSDRDPRSGCVLTGKGKATFHGLAALPRLPIGPHLTPGGRDVKKAHTDTQSKTWESE